jgi:hypothetical protein
MKEQRRFDKVATMNNGSTAIDKATTVAIIVRNLITWMAVSLLATGLRK